jgi:uncharacterized protein DUF4349
MTRVPASVGLVLLLGGLAACDAARNGPPNGFSSAATEPSAPSPDQERLTIQRAQQKVEVAELAPAVDAAHQAASASGGYVESESRDSQAEARLVLRVAAAQLEPTLTRMAALGSEKSRSVSAEDVSESHSDLEVRLRNQEALRDRLRALAARAESVNDVLAVESELARVQAEIESMQARLDRMSHDVKLAALSVTFERTTIYGPLGYFFRAMGWGLQKLFVIR